MKFNDLIMMSSSSSSSVSSSSFICSSSFKNSIKNITNGTPCCKYCIKPKTKKKIIHDEQKELRNILFSHPDSIRSYFIYHYQKKKNKHKHRGNSNSKRE